MWGEVENLIAEEVDQVRICTMDFERASIDAFTEAFPASSAAGCIYHRVQSLYQKVHQIGLSGKYQSDAGSDSPVKCSRRYR